MSEKPNLERFWSYRGGRALLSEIGLLDDLVTIAHAYERFGGGNQGLDDREEMMGPLGWQQEVSAYFTSPNGDHERRGDFDAYKDGVLLEHESGEQMRANWHLLKMEAAYREAEAFRGGSIDAGVLLIPEAVAFPTLERTITDIQAVFANYFDLSIPLFVWEYPSLKNHD